MKYVMLRNLLNLLFRIIKYMTSRISKYKNSFDKFMLNRNCIYNPEYIFDINIQNIIKKLLQNSNSILSILYLTLVNNLNTTDKIINNYYTASGVEIINVLLNVAENKNCHQKIYDKLILNLVLASNKSINENMMNFLESSKDKNTSYAYIINTYNEVISNKNLLSPDKFKFDNTIQKNDLFKWYLNDDDIKKLKKIPQITKESYNEYVNKHYSSFIEYIFILVWFVSNGKNEQLMTMKKMSKYFSMIYKISVDYKNLDYDINNINEYSKNYVINYGIQDSYELFLYNKSKFVEECMTMNIYSTTIEEIVIYLEKYVEEIINNSCPDMKSCNSSIF